MAGVDSVLAWAERTALSIAIRQSDWAVMALEAVHLLGLTLLGGAAVIAAIAALRRGGIGGLSVATCVTELRFLMLAGLLVMAGSGGLIALSMPFKYYNNSAFRWKMVFLLAAVVTTWALTRAADSRSGDARRAPLLRALALWALLLWLGVGFSGRLIGFL
jgi:hypothetical protein